MIDPVLALDSDRPAADVYPALATVLPTHPRAYIVTLGGRFAATVPDVVILRSKGLLLGAYYEAWDQAVLTSSTAGAITPYAADAVRLAAALGFPKGTVIFAGVEASTDVTAQALTDWDAGIRAGGYVAGIYGSPDAPALQAAMEAVSATGAHPWLWSAHYLPPAPADAPLPEWAPPTCGGAPVAAWQYRPNVAGGGQVADLSLLDASLPLWWGTVPKQAAAPSFSDVPADAWYAQDVAEAVHFGLMTGTGPDTFSPLESPTRAQLAAVAVRTRASAIAGVSAPAPRVAIIGEGGGGGGPVHRAEHGMGAVWSHIRSDIAHYLDLFEEALHLRPAAASPVGFSLLPGLGSLGIVNQFGTAMCTCASSDLYVSWLLRHAGQLPPAGGFSWPALYGYTERKYNVDHEGLEPVQVLDVLQSWGIPPWTADPLTTPTETWQQAEAALTPALDAEAARYRISGYGSVPVDLRDIAAAVRIPRPVFLVGAVYPSFESLVPMALQNPPAELVAALGGQGASILGVRPGSWLNQQVVGIHQWLAVGTLPRSFLPDPISEGTGDYAICATTWGGWASGPASLFLVPETYLQAAVSEAWLIHGMQGLAASPRCVALTRQIAQLRAFLRDYPNIPESNKLAISNAIAAAQQTMAQSGCPA